MHERRAELSIRDPVDFKSRRQGLQEEQLYLPSAACCGFKFSGNDLVPLEAYLRQDIYLHSHLHLLIHIPLVYLKVTASSALDDFSFVASFGFRGSCSTSAFRF